VEFARTIHSSGKDLLALINDILDLAKIESGTVSVEAGEMVFEDMQRQVERTFRHVAEGKGIEFRVEVEQRLPRSMTTDVKRLQQVITNLLSNAFKFTEKGSVVMRVALVESGWSTDHPVLARSRNAVAFSITDTGIGISADKQKIIFEAFQQADGSTARKYGGTGLGLNISREVTRLLGGDLRLDSRPGEGSTFTLYLPVNYIPMPSPRRMEAGAPALPMPTEPRDQTAAAGPIRPASMMDAAMGPLRDDRAALAPGTRSVLVVEDDPAFARYLYELAHEKGFRAVVTSRGAEALQLAQELKPDAITLDVSLPDVEGWRVLERLKDDPATRHIPVYLVTVTDEPERSLKAGAMGFLLKPAEREALVRAFDAIGELVDRRVKTLLIVEDDELQRNNILDVIGNGDVKATAVATAAEALEALGQQHFDCMVLDLVLPDRPGLELLHEIKGRPDLSALPIVVYTAKDLNREEELQLRRLARTIILKDVRSPERLLDETALYLHRNAERLPEPKRRILQQLHSSDAVLAGKKVVLVDDDIRNIFALTSVLERHGMEVVSVESGKDALAVLQKSAHVDGVLMDIMLPEMDGYETTRRIRDIPRFKKLPIIALTAKAMKGDREKCIEAGASDYIAKPVDPDQLLTLLRLWMHR